MAKKGPKKPRAPASAPAKSKPTSAEPKASLLGLHARVRALEQQVASLTAGGSDARPLTFTLQIDNAPSKWVQVTLQDTRETLTLTIANPTQPSKPRQPGQTINVAIDSKGDIGQKAVIDVTNVTDATTPIKGSTLTGSTASDAARIETQW